MGIPSEMLNKGEKGGLLVLDPEKALRGKSGEARILSFARD